MRQSGRRGAITARGVYTIRPMPRNALNTRLPDVVNAVVADINATPATRRLGDVMLPSRVKVAALLDGLATVPIAVPSVVK